MGSFLTKIFEKKKVESAPPPANDDLDTSALKPLIKSLETPMEISPLEVAELLKKGTIKLLDVRTPQEFAIASIPGSVLVNQSMVQEIIGTWPKDTAIVTSCHHGMRSLDAVNFLRSQGFTNTRSMTGGIDAWAQKVDPKTPRY
jgi:rhodanese-related sulfurtransferase